MVSTTPFLQSLVQVEPAILQPYPSKTSHVLEHPAVTAARSHYSLLARLQITPVVEQVAVLSKIPLPHNSVHVEGLPRTEVHEKPKLTEHIAEHPSEGGSHSYPALTTPLSQRAGRV